MGTKPTTDAPQDAAHGIRHGIGLRLLTTFLMTAMLATIHQIAEVVPLGQMIFWRSIVALGPILIYMALRRQLPAALKTRHPRLHLTRGLFGVFSMAMSFISLTYLAVANAQALAYLAPLLSLPLAAVLGGEHVSRPVILATAAGFAGVMVMLWNLFSLPGNGALIGIAAGLTYAVTMAFVRVHIKAMTRTESAATVAFYFAVISSLVGLATLPFGWAETPPEVLVWLVASGLLGGLGHICSVESVARAPVSTLAPFDYTGMVWALGFDIFLFGHMPPVASLIGAALITGAALWIALVNPRATARPSPAP
ncbi:DMT family transporter [Pseudoruegeria sp. SK021]|uniref:DMT family transporter n=1 Tax=Pseudoruegeria sp. SK021 TaxID=1933035 RepID=UPI000A23DBA8|nr:DMT family transporter [Pseudoruegeria sp. SK021]OSP56868.1 EamA family transporter [Pseudoruegeria sp. SK021]